MIAGYGLSCLTWSTPMTTEWYQPAPLPFVPPVSPSQAQTSYEERNKLKPEDVVTLWTMSQRTGSVSYLTFGAGFSLAVLVVCVLIFGDERQIGLFRTLGSNALAAYIVQGMAINAVHKLVPTDAPVVAVVGGVILVMGITWIVCRYLEKRGWYLRV